METIGKRIRAVREKHELSQKAFGQRIGMSQTAMTSLETNLHEPRLGTFNAIVEVFKVDPEWLRTGKGTMFTESKPDVVSSPVMNGIDPEEVKDLKKDRDMWREIAMTLAKSSSVASGLLGKLEGNLDAAEIIAAFFRSQMKASSEAA